MVDLNEVLVEWSFVNSSGGVSVMYFDSATATVEAQRIALAGFLAGLGDALGPATSGRIQQSGRVVSAETGTLVGFWDDPQARNFNGSGDQPTLSNATQLVVQWLTPDVVSGRRIRGRTFLPGVSSQTISDGEVRSAFVDQITTGANNFVSSGVGFGIWHRPNGGAPGSHHLATSASLWSEFGVQTGRRD